MNVAPPGSSAAKDASSSPPPDAEPRWRRLARSTFDRVYSETPVSIGFLILCPVVYGVLFFSIGSAFLPGHPAWATLLLWAAGNIGGIIARIVYLPRVIGMLGAGLMLINIPWNAVTAFPSKWGTQIRAGALATIFLRCGCELDFGTMNRFKYPALRLALIPGLTEALFDGGLGVALFEMPFLLSLTMGFILKAVGPGLVVPAMFKLQKARLGTDEGIPSTVVISASFDDVVAITGYAIFSTIAITSDTGSGNGGNAAWEIASGPVQVIFGILGGFIFGFFLGFTKIFDTKLKRFVALYGSALLLMYFLEYWKLLSGGALGSLFVGLVATNAWERGLPRFASLGPSLVFSPEIERIMNIIWTWIMEPMLFVTIGATLDFNTLDTGTIPRSVVIVCCGVTLRTIVTYFTMAGFGYSWKEKLFYAIAWTPKATVQAALSAAPLALINELKVGAPDYDQWVAWGNDILTTGIFAIIICGTLGVTAIHFSSGLLLKPAAEGMDKRSLEPPRMDDGLERRALELVRPGSGDAGERGSFTDGSFDRSTSKTQGLRRRAKSAERGVVGEDYELLAEYMDAIHHLTQATLPNSTAEREEIQRLTDHVMHIQRRIEKEIGQREPSVREIFRTVSQIASTSMGLRGRRLPHVLSVSRRISGDDQAV